MIVKSYKLGSKLQNKGERAGVHINTVYTVKQSIF